MPWVQARHEAVSVAKMKLNWLDIFALAALVVALSSIAFCLLYDYLPK